MSTPNFKVTYLFVIFSEKWHFRKMLKTTFLEISWFYKIHIFVTIYITPIRKGNVTYLRTLKFTEETLRSTQCAHYVCIIIFRKIIKTSDFIKVVNFHQNRKLWKNGWGTILLKTMCVTFEKHYIHSKVYKNLRRKTLCLYFFCTNMLHYFFLKMIKRSDFVKMANFHQNYEFSWNVRSSFGEKWGVYIRKTPGVNGCIHKFPEENIVFT